MLEDRTAKYAVEVFKYLCERPYDVSTKVIAHQLGKSAVRQVPITMKPIDLKAVMTLSIKLQ